MQLEQHTVIAWSCGQRSPRSEKATSVVQSRNYPFTTCTDETKTNGVQRECEKTVVLGSRKRRHLLTRASGVQMTEHKTATVSQTWRFNNMETLVGAVIVKSRNSPCHRVGAQVWFRRPMQPRSVLGYASHKSSPSSCTGFKENCSAVAGALGVLPLIVNERFVQEPKSFGRTNCRIRDR